MTQFAQRLGFDLANAFPGDGERSTHLLQGMLRAILNTKPHAYDFLFPRTERTQHVSGLLLHVRIHNRLGGRNSSVVFDEIAEVGVSLFADGRLQRDRHTHDLADLAHFGLGNVHLSGNLYRCRFAPKHLDQLPRDANQFVDNLDHVHREADRARLISNGSAHCLSNPPRGISRKFVAETVIELIYRLHQADVPLLDQVEELKSAIAILLSDGHNEAQVSFDKFVLCLLRLHLTFDDSALSA